MTLYRLTTQPVRAWQCGTPMPSWAMRACVVVDDTLVLDRPSGRQTIEPGEWLVCDLDGGILWFTHEEFQDTFEEVYS